MENAKHMRVSETGQEKEKGARECTLLDLYILLPYFSRGSNRKKGVAPHATPLRASSTFRNESKDPMYGLGLRLATPSDNADRQQARAHENESSRFRNASQRVGGKRH